MSDQNRFEGRRRSRRSPISEPQMSDQNPSRQRHPSAPAAASPRGTGTELHVLREAIRREVQTFGTGLQPADLESPDFHSFLKLTETDVQHQVQTEMGKNTIEPTTTEVTAKSSPTTGSVVSAASSAPVSKFFLPAKGRPGTPFPPTSVASGSLAPSIGSPAPSTPKAIHQQNPMNDTVPATAPLTRLERPSGALAERRRRQQQPESSNVVGGLFPQPADAHTQTETSQPVEESHRVRFAEVDQSQDKTVVPSSPSVHGTEQSPAGVKTLATESEGGPVPFPPYGDPRGPIATPVPSSISTGPIPTTHSSTHSSVPVSRLPGSTSMSLTSSHLSAAATATAASSSKPQTLVAGPPPGPDPALTIRAPVTGVSGYPPIDDTAPSRGRGRASSSPPTSRASTRSGAISKLLPGPLPMIPSALISDSLDAVMNVTKRFREVTEALGFRYDDAFKVWCKRCVEWSFDGFYKPYMKDWSNYAQRLSKTELDEATSIGSRALIALIKEDETGFLEGHLTRLQLFARFAIDVVHEDNKMHAEIPEDNNFLCEHPLGNTQKIRGLIMLADFLLDCRFMEVTTRREYFAASARASAHRNSDEDAVEDDDDQKGKGRHRAPSPPDLAGRLSSLNLSIDALQQELRREQTTSAGRRLISPREHFASVARQRQAGKSV